MQITETNRVQLSVWNDATRVGKNVCCGGFSFTLADIEKKPYEGWFSLLPEADARWSHQFLGTATSTSFLDRGPRGSQLTL